MEAFNYKAAEDLFREKRWRWRSIGIPRAIDIERQVDYLLDDRVFRIDETPGSYRSSGRVYVVRQEDGSLAVEIREKSNGPALIKGSPK